MLIYILICVLIVLFALIFTIYVINCNRFKSIIIKINEADENIKLLLGEKYNLLLSLRDVVNNKGNKEMFESIDEIKLEEFDSFELNQKLSKYDKDVIELRDFNKDVDFSFSPKDLSLLNYIPELIDIGVKSFKIEGRMKSIYYVATLLSVYRRVIDSYYNGTYKYNKEDEIELYRCANRETLPQYFDKFPGVNEQYYIGRQENTNQDFLGVVLEYDEKNKEIVFEQRNFFKVGDSINIFGPKKDSFNIKVEYIKNEDGELVDAARHPQEILRIPCDKKVDKYDLMRINFFDREV